MSVVGVIHHLYQFAYISLFLTMVDVMTFFTVQTSGVWGYSQGLPFNYFDFLNVV